MAQLIPEAEKGENREKLCQVLMEPRVQQIQKQGSYNTNALTQRTE